MRIIAAKICGAGTRGSGDPCRLAGIEQPIANFHRDKQMPDGYSSYCKECANKRFVARIAAMDPEKLRRQRRVAQMRYQYGLEPDEYEALLAQGCQICTSEEELCVDHDHSTGEVRGVLCQGCNQGLGRFQDDPELLRKAVQYLENHCN